MSGPSDDVLLSTVAGTPAGADGATPRRGARRERRIWAVLVTAFSMLALSAPAASASGTPQAGPGPVSPPFTQCPPIGEDTTCQFLIDVKSQSTPVIPEIIEDPSQIYYDGTDDVTVAVQNESSTPLKELHLGVAGSDDLIFDFDGDGLCSESIVPKPQECPFLAEPNEFVEGTAGNGYAGPDTVFAPEAENAAGYVEFPIPLQPGQYTYFTLEAPPYGTSLTAGEVNDTISTQLTPVGGEPEARLAELEPVNVTDQATIEGPHAATAGGTVEYNVYSDPTCTHKVAVAGKATVVEGIAGPSSPVGASLPSGATYYWQVTYSGYNGGEDTPQSSVCGSESMSFGLASLATTLSGGGQTGAAITVAPGTAVTDTASVSVPGGANLFGTLEYRVYPTAACTPGSEVAYAGGFTTSGIGPSSLPVSLTTPGTYYWQASYEGSKVAIHGASPCGGEIETVAATASSPPAPPAPNPSYTIKSIHGSSNGTITIVFVPVQAGTATVEVTVPTATISRAQAAAAKKKCKKGQVKIHGKCKPANTLAGRLVAAGKAGVPLTLTIKPSSKVKAALAKGRTLHLTAKLSYRSALGGAAAVHVYGVTVKPPKKHHKK